MQSEDNQWMDPLLWELANDLGGGCPASGANGSVQQPIASPPDVQSNISQPLVVNGRYQNVDLTATADLLQQPVPGIQIGLANAASLPANFGSPHDHLGMMGVHGLDNLACYGSLGSGGMLQPPAMLYKQNSYTAAAMTAAATAARPAGSHSPSSSSGGQVGEEYADQSEQYRPKKALNKGALAQKRFRERQKVTTSQRFPAVYTHMPSLAVASIYPSKGLAPVLFVPCRSWLLLLPADIFSTMFHSD